MLPKNLPLICNGPRTAICLPFFFNDTATTEIYTLSLHDALPISATQLVVMCGPSSLAGHFAMRPDSVVALRVSAQDGFANPTPLLGLRAAVADARVFRVLTVAEDSAFGTVTLKPDQAGTTSLAVIANGMRQYLTVTVPPKAAPGKVDCR